MPELRVKLDLGEFHADLSGQYVMVWANAPGDEAFKREFDAYSAAFGAAAKEHDHIPKSLQDQGAAVYAKAWGCTQEEAAMLLWDAGPELGAWMIEQTACIWRWAGRDLAEQAGRLKALAQELDQKAARIRRQARASVALPPLWTSGKPIATD